LKRDSVLSLVSIAKKAGKIAAGEFQTEQAVKSGKASLVIVSEEASENTKKKFRNMCTFYEVPIIFYATKDDLGAAIGCEFRASLAVLDAGFSHSIVKKLEGRGNGGCENGA
jgi:ribosomal protein L7Ae-like RNA K-turn-binding protein